MYNSKNGYIDNVEFDQMKDNALLIDVRTEGEYKTLKKMPGSINYYIYDLLKNTEKYLPDKNQLIITLCNAGNRSSDVMAELRQQGYQNVYVLTHGIYGYYR